MIGMVLVTHGRLAAEFIAALEHVVGPQIKVAAVCIGPDDDMEKRRQDILTSVGEVDDGGGVVVLTDMFGSTPSNIATSLGKDGEVSVVSGVNLPMLVRVLNYPHLRLDRLTDKALSGGRDGILDCQERTKPMAARR